MTRLRKYCLNFVLLLSAAIFMAAAFDASAQLRPWDSQNEVLIDLSVLGIQSGRSVAPGRLALPETYQLPRSYGGDLLVPPRRVPRSRLHVTTAPRAGQAFSGDLLLPKVTLKRPKPRKRAKRRTTAKAKPATRRVARAKKPIKKLQPPPKAAPRTPVAVADVTPKAPAPKIEKTKIEPPKIEKPKIEPPKIEPPKNIVSAPPPPPAIALPKPEPTIAEPKPAPKPAVKKTEVQLASRTPASPTGAGSTNIAFSPGDAKLSADGMKRLDDMAAGMQTNQKMRMQLLAYAGEPNLSSSKARRLSLSRALAVRSYLIKKGVRGTRIDVRALGKKVPDGSPSRVEMRVLQR